MTDEKQNSWVEYSKEKCDEILELIATGKSVAAICRQPGMPHQSSFYRWLIRDVDKLCERYAQAREHQSEVMTQEMLDIALDSGLTAGEINKARLIIDTMKWCAAKLKPKKYGDNQQVNHTGNIQVEQLVIQRTPKTIEHQPEVRALPVIDIDNIEK